MIWVRKVVLFLLSLILFISLLATAFSTSANIAFKNPTKVESWLNKSNLYNSFVSNTITEAIKASGSSQNKSSLGYTAVQQAADNAFTAPLFQNSVNTILQSNYIWLEGKTAKPSFTVDLSSAKDSFAEQIGQYVDAQIKNLPACSPQQLASLTSVDPLNITCLPPGINAQAEAALVTQKIQDSTDFLSNPVITANNINPNGARQTRPYYERFSKAPQLYKSTVKLPWVYGLISILSALGVIFAAPRKRKGLRRTGIILGLAGIVLVIVKLLSDTILKHIEKTVFKNSSTEQIHQALLSFMSQAENQLVKIYLLFGIVFLLLAVIILVFLWSGRQLKKPKVKVTPTLKPTAGGNSGIADRLRGGSRSAAQTTKKAAPKAPPKQPPRRLIQ